MKLTIKKRREKYSRFKYLKQHLTWLRGDLKQKYPYAGKTKIKKWIKEDIEEIEKLRLELELKYQ